MTERRLVVVAAGLSALVGVLYVALLVHDAPLAGDQRDYDAYGRLAADGMWFWLDVPYGTPRPSAWKAPGYPAVGRALVHARARAGPGVGLVQAVTVGPAIVWLTWRLAHRFGLDTRGRVLAAFGVALYPAVWQWTGLLYADALAIPLAPRGAARGAQRRADPAARRRRRRPARRLPARAADVLPAARRRARRVARRRRPQADGDRRRDRGRRRRPSPRPVADPQRRRRRRADPLRPGRRRWPAPSTTRPPTTTSTRTRGGPSSSATSTCSTRRSRSSDSELRSRLIARGRDYIADHPSSVPKAFFYNGARPDVRPAHAGQGARRPALRGPHPRRQHRRARPLLPARAARAARPVAPAPRPPPAGGAHGHRSPRPPSSSPSSAARATAHRSSR